MKEGTREAKKKGSGQRWEEISSDLVPFSDFRKAGENGRIGILIHPSPGQGFAREEKDIHDTGSTFFMAEETTNALTLLLRGSAGMIKKPVRFRS
jgi:hypothetical protein